MDAASPPSEATEILMLEIARMLPEDYRGVYAEPLERRPESAAIRGA